MVVFLLLAKIALSLAGALGLLLSLVGLPGPILLVLLGVALPWLGGSWADFAWIAGAGVLAEVGDWLAGAGLARRAGARGPGQIGAFLGGLVGGILGAPILPPLGLFAGTISGAFLGAWLGERGVSKQGSEASLRAAVGAGLGALVGRGLKTAGTLFQWMWLLGVLWF